MKQLILIILCFVHLSAYSKIKIRFVLKSNPDISAEYKGKSRKVRQMALGKLFFTTMANSMASTKENGKTTTSTEKVYLHSRMVASM